VIVEDEAEDIRGSQMGAISNDSLGTMQPNAAAAQASEKTAPGAQAGPTNSTLAGKRAMDFISMNRDTHSPTPQREQ